MSTEPPDFDSDDRFDDPELQEEHDRLLAELNAQVPPRPRLAPDLEELLDGIGDVMAIRAFGHPCPKPHMFGRFEAYSIRRGGMGLVIEAIDPHLERKVAIKLWMRSGLEAHAALLAEAKTLAKLTHPNVVRIYEPGVWNGRVFFVMEWVEGVDGHDWMAEPRTWQEVLEVYVAAGTGLAAAHDAGIQHRDFKPSNILIGDDGHVVVADFGVADSLHAIPDAEESGKIAGTPSYMAPERLRGKRGDARSDQYSFCVATWQALFGYRPYEGRTGDELLEAIERGEIQEVPGVDVPQWVRAVLRKGLASDPGSRFRSMHELLFALRDDPPDAAVDGGGRDGDGMAVFDGRVLHKPRAESMWAWYSATAMLVFLVGVLGYVAWSQPPAPPQQAVGEVVEVTPYHAILGLVSADEFSEALQLWYEHESELTDAQSLQIAEDCLARAQQLAPVDRATARRAALLALDIGVELEEFAATADIRKAGGRLMADANALLTVDPP